MSKRGRRRSSKRRKSSSSSSKQSISPYIFQKLNRNNVSYKDDIVEKGETDSLRKENVVSGSEDEERSDHAPPKEKRFRQDCPSDSLPHPRSAHTPPTTSSSSSTSEDGERGVSIVTSVSLSDVEDSASPRILVQQSHEPMSERPMSSTAPVTNVLKINCSAPHVKLEIRETLQLHAAGIKTTFVLMDNSSQEIFFKSECERTWTPTNESPEQAVPSMMPGMMPGVPPASPPLLFNIRPPGKRKSCEQSFFSDHFWDIPPPREFADVQLNPLDHLSAGLASCRLGAQSPADQEPQEFQPAFFEGSRSPFSVQADLAPSLDQLSESDNYEPMFMRPSFSTNRSSFTKDFISCQKRRSWIRNNSIATVERRTCPVPRKRRQTFPGTSQGPGTMYDDFPLPYCESFSSLFTCSLPFQTERLSRIQCDDRFSPFGIGDCVSPQRKGSCKPESGIPDSYSGKQSLLSPFYVTSSEENPEDLFSVHEVCARLSSSTLQDQDFKRSLSKDTESPDTDDGEYRADQREFVDSGFDQEILEVDHLREAVVGQRGLAIQITPPSCSGSEEHMMESHPVPLYNNNSSPVHLCPEPRKTSVTIMTAGDPEHRFLQLGSPSSRLLVPTSQDLDSNGSNTEEEPVGEEQDRSSSSHPEEKDLQVDSKGDAQSPGTVVAVAGPSGAMDPPSAPYRGDRQLVFRPCGDNKDHLRPVAPKEADSSSSADHWAKRRKLFKESKQWSSAGASSITSDITEESEETRSMEVTEQDDEDRGLYTETFHSSAWIFHGDDVVPEGIHSSLSTRTRAVSIRDRTVKINKGTGEYPWGFRIQFSKPIVVTEVDTNGAAEEAGLMVGDYVLAVNGIDVTSIPHSEAADLARQGPDILTLTIGSDIARGPNTPRPACRGYLHKRTQSGLIKGWRKRWFVLRHDCCLYYYRHKRDEGKRRALSVVKLEGAEVGADLSLGKPFVFRCRPLTGNRVFFFWAPSNQEMKRWLEAMQKAIHPITQNHVWVDVTRHNSNLPPLAVKNPDCLGLLHKMDKSRDTWLQHYCILKDGCLYMYSGIRATHAHGGIYLQGYMVREQPHGSKKSTIELKPPSDEFKTFHLCAENATENKRWILAIRASIRKWLYLHQALKDYMSRPPEETRM